MSVKKTAVLLCAALALSAFAPQEAAARDGRDRHGHHDRHDHGKGNKYGHYKYKHGAMKHYGPRYHYAPPRTVVHHYHAPRVRERIVHYRPVPWHVARHLSPAPHGYYYSMGERDVLVVSRHGNMIEGFIRLAGY